MAGESCNLDKDEAEILKPTSSPQSPPSPSPLLIKPSQEFLAASDSPPLEKVESYELKNEAQPYDCASGESLTAAAVVAGKYVNRCSSCRKRVGLTGFRCRCSQLFCPQHRYSNEHDCSFDYKAAGRVEIAKANPVIRAAKILKI